MQLLMGAELLLVFPAVCGSRVILTFDGLSLFDIFSVESRILRKLFGPVYGASKVFITFLSLNQTELALFEICWDTH